MRLPICETEAVIAKLGREVCTISSRYRGVRRHFRGFQVIHGLFATRGMMGGGPAALRCTVLLPPRVV